MGLVLDRAPDLFNERRVDHHIGFAGEIQDEAQVGTGEHPVHIGIFFDMAQLSAFRRRKSINLRKVVERRCGHPAGSRDSMFVNGGKNAGVVSVDQLSSDTQHIIAVTKSA